MTEPTQVSLLRVFLGALAGGVCAAALWILLATVNAMGAGIFLWPLGLGAGLGARFAGGRDKRSGYLAAGVAIVTILAGDATALRQSITYFRDKIQVSEQAYEARRAEAEFWVNRPAGMSREELEAYHREHRITIDYSEPGYEPQFSDRDEYFAALEAQLTAFHETPPPANEYLGRKLAERLRRFDQSTNYRHAWRRLYMWPRWILLGLAALSAYLTVCGRPASSPGGE